MLSRLVEFSDCPGLWSNGILNTIHFCPDRRERFLGKQGEEAAVRKGRQGFGMAIVYILIGGIVGSVLGRLLDPVWAPLGRTLLSLGSQPGTSWSVNLGIVGLQVGGWIQMNVVGVIGLIVGLFWYQRRSS